MQSKTKMKTGVSPLVTPEGKTVESNEGKADILNSFFSSVFTREDADTAPNLGLATKSKGVMLENVDFTVEDVKKKLEELNTNKACGPDAIPSKILKELSNEIAMPLYILFKKSIEEKTVPDDWKTATVIPIFKKGTRTEPGNYRPVSLTCVTCKIMESIIRDALAKHMGKNELYAKCQHGFRPNRSCVTQLMEVMEDFTKELDTGENIDVIYLDFRKAFDSVPHERLLKKMESYGITGNLLGWIRDFLTKRTQKVRIGSSLSRQAEVLSGIPQGSILGPILFTIFYKLSP